MEITKRSFLTGAAGVLLAGSAFRAVPASRACSARAAGRWYRRTRSLLRRERDKLDLENSPSIDHQLRVLRPAFSLK
jgi:hypothetical protein